MREVVVPEWGSASPRDAAALAGIWPDDADVAADLATLPPNALTVTGLREGMGVQVRQHVGVVRLGPVQLRVLPKLKPDDLWTAVAWALGLDELSRLPAAEPALDGDFLDLLGALLLSESARIWAAGIHRGYVREERWLAAPRGRPDLTVLARHQPLTRAALPCRSHALSAETPANQVVVGALEVARRAVRSVALRGALHRAWVQWSQACGPARLSGTLLDAATTSHTRLTVRYDGAHRVARALHDGTGLGELEDEHAPRTRMPGFLWDMSRVWESFATRFLSEFLPGRVRAQQTLRHLYRVRTAPVGWAAPKPRPDLVIEAEGRPALVVDTKYRDIGRRGLPRDMLYQLSVYALAWSRDGAAVPAVALFPGDGDAVATELDLTPPEGGARRILAKGVDWSAATRVLAGGDRRDGERLALEWVRM